MRRDNTIYTFSIKLSFSSKEHYICPLPEKDSFIINFITSSITSLFLSFSLLLSLPALSPWSCPCVYSNHSFYRDTLEWFTLCAGLTITPCVICSLAVFLSLHLPSLSLSPLPPSLSPWSCPCVYSNHSFYRDTLEWYALCAGLTITPCVICSLAVFLSLHLPSLSLPSLPLSLSRPGHVLVFTLIIHFTGTH